MPEPSAAGPPARLGGTFLARLLRGTFWLAFKSPLQVVIAFWSIPLVQHAIGAEANGAYVFAWGFGFVQLLLEFGMSSALQREMALAWARRDFVSLNRLVGSGMVFYAITTFVQFAILVGIAHGGIPSHFVGDSRRLVVGLLWLQAVSAPLYGLLAVVSSVLQAARRYDVLPALELIAIVVRFLVLVIGLHLGVNFLAIVALQTAIQLAVMLAPSLYVVVRELGFVPHFAGANRSDFSALARIGFYVFLMQLSVVLGDKVDTTILGYALPTADVGHGITIYQNISKPFIQIRQTGWTLAYLIMPAVASLAAVGDVVGLERIKYDAPRLLVGLLLPPVLLGWIFAAPFLSIWVGPEYAPYAPWMRLFLVATLPVALSVHAQMAIGLGRIEVVALSPLAGSFVNLPLSYYLTTRLGVPGVIWGTVLTTLTSNLVVPGIYLFRVLEIRPAAFLSRTLGAPLAGAVGLLFVAGVAHTVAATGLVKTTLQPRWLSLLFLLTVCSIGYVAGYLATSPGRRDLTALARQIQLRQSRRLNDQEPEPTS